MNRRSFLTSLSGAALLGLVFPDRAKAARRRLQNHPACYCGCELLGNRSLLTCYSPTGMARGCPICQGEARLAYRRWKEGQSLEQIRRAIDARYS